MIAPTPQQIYQNRELKMLKKPLSKKSTLASIIVGTIAGVGLTVGLSEPARADFVVCNRTGRTASFALGFLDNDGTWTSAGWVPVSPGSCRTPYSGNLAARNSYWYYYAVSSEGAWEGGHPFCVRSSAFTKYNANRSCRGSGSYWRYFTELYIDSANFILNLR